MRHFYVISVFRLLYMQNIIFILKKPPNQSKYPRRRLHIEWRSLKCVKRNNNPDRHIQNRVKGNTDARQKRR